MLCFSLATMVGARAQCSDFVSIPAGPVVINLTLDAFGQVNLTNAVLNANGFTKNAACDYWLSQTPAVLASYNNTPINFDCTDIPTSPQTWYVRAGGLPTISDDMGPGSTIVPITVNIIDNIYPTITCIANQVRNAGGTCTYTAAGAEFDYSSANDNCATNITHSLSGATTGNGGSTLAGVVFGSGVTTVTWTVKDNALPTPNQATCSFTVTVNDVTIPTITCPANVVAPNAPANGTCQWVGTGLEVTNGMVADNCATDAFLLGTLTNNLTGSGNLNGYNFGLGVTNVTYTINDGVNAPVNCMFSVDVTDQTNPSITCPANITVNASASPACNYTVAGSSFNASASDNCSLIAGQPVVVLSGGYNGLVTLNGASFSVGTTVITWSATDASANVSTCSQSVTVVDVTAPTVVALPPGLVTFQSVFNVNTAPGSCSQSVTWYRPSALTHNATDCSGVVTLTEVQTVSINCPGLTCVNDPNFFTTNGVTPLPYDATNPLQWVTPVSANFPVGTTVITYNFTDAYGNITPVTVTVNVTENQPPVAKCVASTVTLMLDPIFNIAFATPALINNGSTDNCGISDMTTDDVFTANDESQFNCTQLGSNVVTLYVTDNAGNTSTCTSTVFVVDNNAPQIGCPSSFVVPNFPANGCTATVPGLVFNPATPPTLNALEYYDNSLDVCGLTFDYQVNGGAFNPLGLFLSTPVDLSGVVFSAGNNTVTLRAMDGSGNIFPCTFSVNVQDQTGPVYASGPAAGSTIIASVPNIGSCSAKAIWADPTFTDNCGGPVTIVSQTAFSNVTIFSADNGGITPVTYVVRDAAGNLTTHTFNVQVVDTQFPVAKCKDITVNLSSTIGAGSVTVTPANIDNASTDNCGYTYVSGNITYNCANLGNNNYTLLIKDDANNQASCVGVVTVKDVTAPTFTCPANVTLNANASCVASLTGTATATDNCSITKFEYDVDPPVGTNFQLLNNGVTGTLANIPALPLGVNTITLRASDGATPNNSSTCTFTATVRDVTVPVFADVPANVTVACNAIPPVTNPTATDNCGTATVTFSGQTFSPGTCNFTITRTWVATDNATPANTVSVSQVITVQDIVGPVFNAAYLPTGTVNINVAGPGICTGNYTLTVVNNTDISDACNGVSGISYTLLPAGGMLSSGTLTLAAGTFTLPVSSFAIGTNVVTLTATDACGNPTVKVINIVVADNQAPVFQNAYAAAPAGRCGQVYTLPNTTNNCDQLFTWTRPGVNDVFDCGNKTVTETISNGTVQSFINLINPFGTFPPVSPNVIAQFPVGETTVTYTATQGANVSTCSFVVKILDTQAPTITCPPNANLSISNACAAAATVPVYSPASVSDNCQTNVSVSQTPAAGSLVSSVVAVVPGNTFTVTLKATDNMPNNLMSAPCSFTITLIDGQSPVPVITSLPDVVSNCTKDTVTAPSATDCNGINIVTIYGTPSVPVMMVLPPLVVGGPPRYVLNPGSYVITWSYTDPQNNTTTQPQNVFIAVDLTAPIAIAQPLNVNLDALGSATVTAAQLNNGSFDQDGCGPVAISIRTGTSPNFVYVPSVDFDCTNLANMGVNQVVFAATDINGNTATVQTTVTVHDVTAPVFTNNWTATQMDTSILACADIPPAASFPQLATDQCDLVVNIALTETSTQTGAGCSKYSYVINRIWTASDDSGNTTTRTQKITVLDSQAPVFAANTPATVTGNTAPNSIVCSAQVTFDMRPYVSDCQLPLDVTITNTLISAPMGNTFVIPSGSNISAPNYPLGTYVIRFTATDLCGNSSTKDVTVTVSDVTPPTAVCINGVSASLQPSGLVVVTVNQFNNFSYDNCTSPLDLQIQRLDVSPLETPTPTLTYDCDDADGVTHHDVKLYVTDEAGNTSVCQTYIVIQDNVAPVLTCPSPVTVDCASNLSVATLGTPTITDNCTPGVPTSTDAFGPGAGNICEVLTRTWKVIDQANNMGTCDQLINITDTIPPAFISTPANLTVSCEDPLVVAPVLTATDNCSVGSQIVVDFTEVSTKGLTGCSKYNYTTTRTWHATDKCGNVATHTQVVVVTDTKAPTFPGLPATETVHANSFPAVANVCTVPVELDAEDFLVECAALSECTIDSIVFSPALPAITPVGLNVSGNYPVGTTNVTFYVTDPCGNKGIDSIEVVVIDDALPTMVCQSSIVVALGSNGEATIAPDDVDISSFDNCGIDTLFLSKTTFDCGDMGVNNVNLTATDIYGNSNFCTVTVEVTLGNNVGFNVTTTGTAETFFGAGNGEATVTATGGSGTFLYNWSTTETISTITGLDAGIYTVTVVDANTGCLSIDTAVIDAGAKVTVNVGTGDGCQGTKLVIPVTVDNFIDVTGFSFGLQLDNAAAGTIVSISDVNPAITGAVLTANSIFWSSPLTTGTDIANGELLFNVTVQLSNAPTPVGTTSVISASALPSLAFIQTLNNVLIPATMIVFNNGTATISCPANDIEVAGDITTWKVPVQPIPGVNVALTGTVLGNDATVLPLADYSFLVPGGANTVVTPNKVAAAKSTKINVGDLLFIQAHAAPPPVQIAFTSPYQYLAGDINGDKTVNIIDYALVQAYIVNNQQTDGHFHFNPAPPDWKFVPKSYVFPAPNPLNPAPPSSIDHTNVLSAFLDDDFIGVLLGDVNGDVIPTFTNNSGADYAGTFKLRINERSVQAGETVTVPFKASDFNNRQAYQLTIAFDPTKFELAGIEPGVLPDLSDANFGTSQVNDGLISTLWVGTKPLSFNDNDVLFSLTFKALGNVNALSDVLHTSSDIAEPIAIDNNGNIDGVDFEFVTSVGTGELENKVFALYQNQPNPFSTETTISFRLPEAGRARLHIFGTDGRMIKTIIGDYPAGNNAVNIRKDDFGAPGVYWYELETAQHSDRKKMILIN